MYIANFGISFFVSVVPLLISLFDTGDSSLLVKHEPENVRPTWPYPSWCNVDYDGRKTILIER